MTDRMFHTIPLIAALVLCGSAASGHADPADNTVQGLRVAAGRFRQEVIGCAAASHRPLRAGMDSRPKRLREEVAIAEICRRDLLNRVDSLAQSLRKTFMSREKTTLIDQWQETTVRNIKLLNNPREDQMRVGDQISRDFDDFVFNLSW
jgi:hypothetical protein